MVLPAEFQFSQNNLQDYLDCPRRFELKYILRQPWPAIQTEPVREFERHIELGSKFHRLIQQQKSGISTENLVNQIDDPQLQTWWQRYLDDSPRGLPSQQWIETTLSAPFLSYRLVAKYDLVALDPEKSCVIVDWKTSKFHPKKERLLGNCQSKVYPLLLAIAGTEFTGNQVISPEFIKMIYWYAEYPAQPIELIYSESQHKANMEFLTGLVKEIAEVPTGGFDLTLNLKHCNYCVYRSLCARGIAAGDWKDSESLEEDNDPPTIDFDQIPEIEF